METPDYAGVSRRIHPTAIVHPKAELGKNVEIGPYCIVGPDVVIGDGTKLESHVVIEPDTVVGENCRIYPGAVLGGDPQDLKYGGERTKLYIGSGNIIREHVTMSRGTPHGRGETRVGDNNMFMAYSHVGHDCIVGSGVVLTNSVALGGHSVVEDGAVLGGMAGVHQFARVGKMAMVGGFTKVVKDVPPFMLVDGNPAEVSGINVVGLRRKGVSPDARDEIRKLYKILYRSKLNVSQAMAEIEKECRPIPEVLHFLEFLRTSARGIIK